MERAGYSMRLRPREKSIVIAPSDSGSGAANKASASSRTILGDVSNRNAKAGDGKDKKTRSTRSALSRTSGISNTNNTAVGSKRKAVTSKAITAVVEEKLTRRSSSRIASISKDSDKIDGNNSKKEQGGAKRTTEENNLQAGGRGRTKRAKTAESDSTVNSRAIRTRSSLQGEKPARRRNVNESSVEKRENIVEIVKDDHYIVPLNFRLKRASFNGQNYTYGIAHYDAPERSDPFLCKDYVTDMFQYFYHVETQTCPRGYMDDQDDINAKMRAILVDWLVEVHMKFRLVPETLHLCVNIIDRYCSKISVQRSKLQLIGVTALLVACKHEEIYPPEVRDCVYITDRAYDRQEVLDMEQSILKVLNWKISVPTAYPFLDRFLNLTKASPLTRHAATYYLERTLQEHELLDWRPSVVCAGAVILALNNPNIRVQEEDYERDLPGLPKILMEYTEFDKEELLSVMSIIGTKVSEEPITASRRQLTSVKRKYENKKYLSVAAEVELPSVHYVTENMQDDRRWF